MSQYGIQNLKEVLALVFTVAVAIVREIKKDGFQPQDLLAFLQSKDFEKVLKPAIDDIGQVGNEASDIGYLEGFELARYAYAWINDVIDELK